jgi:hypothetical protein
VHIYIIIMFMAESLEQNETVQLLGNEVVHLLDS